MHELFSNEVLENRLGNHLVGAQVNFAYLRAHEIKFLHKQLRSHAFKVQIAQVLEPNDRP